MSQEFLGAVVTQITKIVYLREKPTLPDNESRKAGHKCDLSFSTESTLLMSVA